MMKTRNMRLLAALVPLVATCAPLSAQTISVGTGSGMRGGMVSVPVSLAASTDHTAALVRLEYDPAVLENPSVFAGALVSAGHVVDFHSPEAGRLNVAVYADSGMPAFAAQSGTLFTLQFEINLSAPGGTSAIGFTTVGTPALPSSDLTDTVGAVVSHTTTGGSVTVGGTAAYKSWTLYR